MQYAAAAACSSRLCAVCHMASACLNVAAAGAAAGASAAGAAAGASAAAETHLLLYPIQHFAGNEGCCWVCNGPVVGPLDDRLQAYANVT